MLCGVCVLEGEQQLRKVATRRNPFRGCEQICPTGWYRAKRGTSSVQRHLGRWRRSGVPENRRFGSQKASQRLWKVVWNSHNCVWFWQPWAAGRVAGGVHITRDALVCVGFQSGLDVAPASLGQDRSLKFPFCGSVLGNVPKSPGKGKGNFVETGDDNTQNKIFCIAVSPMPNTSGSYTQQWDIGEVRYLPPADDFHVPILGPGTQGCWGATGSFDGKWKKTVKRGLPCSPLRRQIYVCKSGFLAQRWVKGHRIVLWGTSLQGRELGLSPNAVSWLGPPKPPCSSSVVLLTRASCGELSLRGC